MSLLQQHPTSKAAEAISIRVNHLLFINGKMSQRVLAMRLGIKAGTMSGKMAGSTRWNVDELAEMCEIFQVTADYLLGRSLIESAKPVTTEGPNSFESGPSDLVAGTGFEPATSSS